MSPSYDYVLVHGVGMIKHTDFIHGATLEEASENAQRIIDARQQEEAVKSPIATVVVVGTLYQKAKELHGLDVIRAIPTRSCY